MLQFPTSKQLKKLLRTKKKNQQWENGALLPWYWEGDSDGRPYLCFLPSFQSMAETRNKAFVSAKDAS